MLELSIIAVSLGMDAFSIAFTQGLITCCNHIGRSLRLTFAFAFFQSFMTLIGFILGGILSPWLNQFDVWVMAGILILIGLHMILEALRNSKDDKAIDLSRGWLLIMIAFATSIDALAIGFSFSLINRQIWIPAAAIGLVAGLMTISGFYIGRFFQRLKLKRVGLIGGFALIGIALKIVLERL